MKRLYLDCLDEPESKCSVSIAADSEKELIEAATQHAVSVHGYKDSPELRQQLRSMFKEMKTPVAA